MKNPKLPPNHFPDSLLDSLFSSYGESSGYESEILLALLPRHKRSFWRFAKNKLFGTYDNDFKITRAIAHDEALLRLALRSAPKKTERRARETLLYLLTQTLFLPKKSARWKEKALHPFKDWFASLAGADIFDLASPAAQIGDLDLFKIICAEFPDKRTGSEQAHRLRHGKTPPFGRDLGESHSRRAWIEQIIPERFASASISAAPLSALSWGSALPARNAMWHALANSLLARASGQSSLADAWDEASADLMAKGAIPQDSDGLVLSLSLLAPKSRAVLLGSAQSKTEGERDFDGFSFGREKALFESFSLFPKSASLEALQTEEKLSARMPKQFTGSENGIRDLIPAHALALLAGIPLDSKTPKSSLAWRFRLSPKLVELARHRLARPDHFDSFSPLRKGGKVYDLLGLANALELNPHGLRTTAVAPKIPQKQKKSPKA